MKVLDKVTDTEALKLHLSETILRVRAGACSLDEAIVHEKLAKQLNNIFRLELDIEKFTANQTNKATNENK